MSYVVLTTGKIFIRIPTVRTTIGRSSVPDNECIARLRRHVMKKVSSSWGK